MDDIINTFLDVINFEYFAKILLPGKCYTSILKNWEITNVTCLKILLSKFLGYGIITGSVLVKIPQIIKMFYAKSGDGINLNGVTLELIASMSTLCYGYNQGFPFSAYGESLSMSFQTCIIGVLVLYYSRQYYTTLIYLFTYVVTLAFLMSPVAHPSVLWTLQALVIPNMILGRSLQVKANYQNGHTGQLSAITSTLLTAGSAARVFTTWVETKDVTVTLTFLISFITNLVIFSQIVYYRNETIRIRKLTLDSATSSSDAAAAAAEVTKHTGKQTSSGDNEVRRRMNTASK